MSADNITGWGTEQQRRRWRELDHADIYSLQVVRVAGFAIALFVLAAQIVAFMLQREMNSVVDGTDRLWALGGLALGFVCGELIKSKRRIAALEKRLAGASEGSDR